MAVPTIEVDGDRVRPDPRDVAAWAAAGHGLPGGAGDGSWTELAEAYVRAHPRPDVGTAGAQRLVLLRRLAAGPAATADLLTAMRGVGWVGASDLENRLRDIRQGERRAGGGRGGLLIHSSADQHRLAESFPSVDRATATALAFTRQVLGRVGGPMAAQALAALDGLLPDLHEDPPVNAGPGEQGGPDASGEDAHRRGAQPRPAGAAGYRASAAALQRFFAAQLEGRAVRVRYFSMNAGHERTYELVPVELVPLGPVLKAICVPVDEAGRRDGSDKQFALDRLIDVQDLPQRPVTPIGDLRLARSEIVMDVGDGLYQVLRQRGMFGIRDTDAAPSEHDPDVWRVRGTFADALAWDVMEQLCAWAGSACVLQPLWLVNAVCRRLRAGLRVMETGEEFVLVKPEVGRRFDDHGEAVHHEPAAPVRGPGGPARRLTPR